MLLQPNAGRGKARLPHRGSRPAQLRELRGSHAAGALYLIRVTPAHGCWSTPLPRNSFSHVQSRSGPSPNVNTKAPWSHAPAAQVARPRAGCARGTSSCASNAMRRAVAPRSFAAARLTSNKSASSAVFATQVAALYADHDGRLLWTWMAGRRRCRDDMKP
jgi:hypothetical protein